MAAIRTHPAFRRAAELMENGKNRVIAGGVVLATLAGGGFAALKAGDAPSFESFETGTNALCFEDSVAAGAPPQAPVSVRDVLTDETPDRAALCAVESQTNQAGRQLVDWLHSDAGHQASRADRKDADLSIRENRVAAAAADLALVDFVVHDDALSPTSLAAALDTTRSNLQAHADPANPDALVQDYLQLLSQPTHAQEIADGLSTRPLQDDLRVLRAGIPDASDHPEWVAGGKHDALYERTRDLQTSDLTALAQKYTAIAHTEVTAKAEALDTLTLAANPTWAADHPGQKPSADEKAAVDAALQAGKPFAQLRAERELTYRNQPGVVDKHLPEILSQAVQPAYAAEFPSGTPSQPIIDAAKAAYLTGATMDQIRAATAQQIHQLPEWRESFIQPNLGEYYAQPDYWSCGPSSATNVMNLLGITPASYAVREAFVQRLGTRPEIGTPGGVAAIAAAVKRMAADDYGVQLTGYAGNSRDIGAVQDALRNGYVLIVHGDVVGKPNAGHFLAIKDVTPEGNLVMADPWMPEFANRTITPQEFEGFTGGNGIPQFYALGRA